MCCPDRQHSELWSPVSTVGRSSLSSEQPIKRLLAVSLFTACATTTHTHSSEQSSRSPRSSLDFSLHNGSSEQSLHHRLWKLVSFRYFNVTVGEKKPVWDLNLSTTVQYVRARDTIPDQPGGFLLALVPRDQWDTVS